MIHTVDGNGRCGLAFAHPRNCIKYEIFTCLLEQTDVKSSGSMADEHDQTIGNDWE
jgi:hypothetical protein